MYLVVATETTSPIKIFY